jgi:hypothetical protein
MIKDNRLVTVFTIFNQKSMLFVPCKHISCGLLCDSACVENSFHVWAQSSVIDGSELDEIMASLDCDGTSGQTDPDEVPEPPGSDWTEAEPL